MADLHVKTRCQCKFYVGVNDRHWRTTLVIHRDVMHVRMTSVSDSQSSGLSYKYGMYMVEPLQFKLLRNPHKRCSPINRPTETEA